jgi:hypothetical protein
LAPGEEVFFLHAGTAEHPASSHGTFRT